MAGFVPRNECRRLHHDERFVLDSKQPPVAENVLAAGCRQVSTAFDRSCTVANGQHLCSLCASLVRNVFHVADIVVGDRTVGSAGRRTSRSHLYYLSRLWTRFVFQLAPREQLCRLRRGPTYIYAVLPLALGARHSSRQRGSFGQAWRGRHLDDDRAGILGSIAMEQARISSSAQPRRAF